MKVAVVGLVCLFTLESKSPVKRQVSGEQPVWGATERMHNLSYKGRKKRIPLTWSGKICTVYLLCLKESFCQTMTEMS